MYRFESSRFVSPGSVSSIIRFGSTGPVSFHHVSFRVVSRGVRFCTLRFVSFPLVLVVLPFRFASFRFSHVPSGTFRFVSLPPGASNVIWLDITCLHRSIWSRMGPYGPVRVHMARAHGSYGPYGPGQYRFVSFRFQLAKVPFRIVSGRRVFWPVPFRIVSRAPVSQRFRFVSFRVRAFRLGVVLFRFLGFRFQRFVSFRNWP